MAKFTHYQRGTVKWWNDPKGFGFITPSDGGPDVFAHYSQMMPRDGERCTLAKGDTVTYTRLEDADRGAQAVAIEAVTEDFIQGWPTTPAMRAKVGA